MGESHNNFRFEKSGNSVIARCQDCLMTYKFTRNQHGTFDTETSRPKNVTVQHCVIGVPNPEDL